MKKRVLFVVDERKLGGVSIVLENILNKIDLKRLDITVLVLHNNGTRLSDLRPEIKVIYGPSSLDAVDQGVKALVLSGKIFKAAKKLYLAYLMKKGKAHKYLRKIRNNMNLGNYDIEVAFKAGICSVFVASGDSKYKLNWVHEDYKTYNMTKRYEKYFKTVFDAFDKHIIVSEDAAKSFNEIYGCESKTVIIENYIDEAGIIAKAKQEADITVSNKRLNIVTLGRFCYEKGFDRVITSLAKLKEDNIKIDKIKVYILGYGKEQSKLNKMITEYGLENNVQVITMGELENNPYAFMKNCDMYIMPSRSESFGMVRIEALILGLPVLTTNVANTNKMINNEIGLVVENTDEGIYKGLKQILTDDELVSRLKENTKYYTYEGENKRIINNIMKVLEEETDE
ncbi:MAG: glycosyltransferase [Clostridia bacterium]|nr:glycosyltransferase [Clostridia bacterium]